MPTHYTTLTAFQPFIWPVDGRREHVFHTLHRGRLAQATRITARPSSGWTARDRTMDGVSHDYERPRDLTYANLPFLDL